MQQTQAQTQKFILKFFPEIMIKGAKAKRQMIAQLYGNVQKLLKQIDENISTKKFFDKIEVVCPIDVSKQVKQRLLDTPGIELVLEALQFDEVKTIDDIKVIVNELMHPLIQNKTFVVRVKRSGTHTFKSPQIEQGVGGYMLAQNPTSKVDLHHPEVTINLELLDKQLNIITQKYYGLGGFPIGTQGDILSLMSGGFDSTVASYLTMKRGIKTHFLFFNLGGIAHEIGVKQVAFYLWNKFGSSHKVSFTSVPFDDVVGEIFNSISEPYMGVMLKRLMLQAAEQIANTMKIDALLTGESVAQVSSQTLRNLSLIDQATSKLVLRPLCTMNKPEIMDIAQKIGTKKFAESMPEYCGVISKHPVTHGSYERVQKESNNFNDEVLNQAVANAVTIDMHEAIKDIGDIGQIEIVHEIPNDNNHVIIDIRQDDACIKAACETIKIPFHQLKAHFPKLMQDKTYLLYCDKGVLSQLHAQYLKDALQCENIKVYRPQKGCSL